MYFEKPGKDCTAQTVELALKAAKEENISAIVVASGSGYTARFFKEAAQNGMKVVVVTHANGYKEPGSQELSPEIRKELEDCGMQAVTTSHVLSKSEAKRS